MDPVKLLISLILYLFHTSWANNAPDIRAPPAVQAPKIVPDTFFKSGGSFVLPCNATGVPPPKYVWYQTDPLGVKGVVDLNRREIIKMATGSIEITHASSLDEGDYQCIAENPYGKSMSQVFQLKRASLGSFPADKAVKEFRGNEGSPLRVTRIRTSSSPDPIYGWKIVDGVDDQTPRKLTLSRRIMQDLEGNLYFTSLRQSDAMGGREFYKVDVFNNVLDTTAGGSYSRVIVDPGRDAEYPAKLLYPERNEITVIVLEGQDLKLQCIFGGNPSVRITWTGPATRREIVDYDTTFIVTTATRADEGTYTCTGGNDAGEDMATIHVDVQSIPKFTSDGKPRMRVMSEDDTVHFRCQTTWDTEPPAEITWMVNTVPIDDKHPGARTEVRNIDNGKELSIINLKREDIKVIQCNVSNTHKTMYIDAPLNVLLRTKVVSRPEDVMVMENDTKAVFMCAATTDPSTKLTINWTRDGKPILFYDDPHIVVSGGMLTIHFNSTSMEERARYAGLYGCNASNTYSYSYVQAELDFINKPNRPAEVVTAGSWWWIIVLVVVILLLIIVILVCCLCCRDDGDEYPVDEKERANGNDPVGELEKDGYHDYVRPAIPAAKRKGSRASLSSTVFMGSTNSLNDLDFGERMSEDGSFIGMYTDTTDRRRLKPSYSEA